MCKILGSGNEEVGMPWVFLLISLVGALLTWNVYHPSYAPSRRAAISFFVGWLTIELALHHIALQAVVTAVLISAGALRGWPGDPRAVDHDRFVGRSGASLLARLRIGGGRREGVVRRSRRRLPRADPARGQGTFARGVDWKEILLPFPMRHPEVERIRDITYCRVRGVNLKLDVYRHRSRPRTARRCCRSTAAPG